MRARILHARAFRRLAGKTQVFTRLPGDPPSDHFRSRLTHTLEVTQIARTLACALGLNAELAEALALAHDIGHPPFGHAGEKALDHALAAHGLSFDHNLHALRIVTWFEERYAAFRGLNLTLGVREGIVKHSHDYSAADASRTGRILARPVAAAGGATDRPGRRDRLPDRRSRRRAGLGHPISGTGARGRTAVSRFSRRGARRSSPLPRPSSPSTRRCSGAERAGDRSDGRDALARVALGVATLAELRSVPQRLAALSPRMEAERAVAKKFLYANLYNSPDMEEAHAHADRVVEGLFATIMADPGLLPEDHRAQIPAEGLARTVADYIAGMTDSYIESTWARCGGR